MVRRMLSGGREVRQWWRKKVAKVPTPFFAQSEAVLRPETVGNMIPGHHFSVVLKPGIRTYCFESQSDRDRFLQKFSDRFDVSACENPEQDDEPQKV